MFGSKTRRIRELSQRITRITEQRDYHKSVAETARAVSSRTAARFTDSHELGWAEAARHAEHAQHMPNLLARHGRLLRATSRLRAECAAKDQRIRVLEQQVDHWVGPGADRAIVPCGPVAPDAVKDRQIRELQQQLHGLQQRLTERQNATEAADWQATGTSVKAAA